MSTGRAFSWVRDADWFGPDRATNYARIVAIIYVPVVVAYYLLALRDWGCDFAVFWSAGKLSWRDGVLAYSTAALRAESLIPGSWGPFVNPPPYLLLLAPFGLLPLAVAFALWIVLGLAVYVSCGRPLRAVWPMLAFPPVYVNSAIGQNGLFTGALFIGGMLQLQARPFVAGLLLGALVIKPHLAILIPAALIAAGRWRAVAGAAVSSFGLLAASWLAFGTPTFAAFLRATQLSQEVLTRGVHALKMQSPFAAVLALSGNVTAATWVQVVLALGMLSLVWVTWRRPGDQLGKASVLVVATALATPYIYEYDLAFLILPIVWLAQAGTAKGFHPWERLLIGVAFVAPFAAQPLAMAGLGFNIGPFVHLMLLGGVLRRQYGGGPDATAVRA